MRLFIHRTTQPPVQTKAGPPLHAIPAMQRLEMGGGGSESIQVGSGPVYAHWFGSANGRYGLGVFALKITFQPAGTTAVPLPGAFVLLLSGLGLMFAIRWRRAAAFAVALAWAWNVPA